MMKLHNGLILVVGGLLLCAGCVQAPKSIDVQVGNSRPEPVDSSRVPNPRTLEEARAELRKAYANIQWLEDEVADLEQDKARYKRERDECEDRLERYEDD
jgi:predicted  nucleic acid-binding Zn-ribbon protein